MLFINVHHLKWYEALRPWSVLSWRIVPERLAPHERRRHVVMCPCVSPVWMCLPVTSQAIPQQLLNLCCRTLATELLDVVVSHGPSANHRVTSFSLNWQVSWARLVFLASFTPADNPASGIPCRCRLGNFTRDFELMQHQDTLLSVCCST